MDARKQLGIGVSLSIAMIFLQPVSTLADENANTADEGMPEHCLEYRANPDADLGEVLRAGCEPSLVQMSRLMDNPIGNVAMFFNQYDSYNMENPKNGKEAIQANYMMLFQFPKRLNEDWNLINRVVLNVASAPLDQDKIDDFSWSTLPGQPGNNPGELPTPIDQFDGRTTNLGDTYYVGLFAPNEPTILANGAKFLWGVGFDLGLDTAQEDILGSGKYTGGPSALVVYMGETFKGGALIQHYKDFAGDDDADDVNLTNIQALYYWSLDETTSIGAGPNIVANWEQDSDNTWTVPIGMGISKTVQIGKVPVRFGVEFHYTVIEPDDIVAPKWNLRFYVIPAAPSALFEWMQ
jgi:hypothetical protein